MTVTELIQELEKLDPEKLVKIWNPGLDDETENVIVSDGKTAVWVLPFEVTW